MASKPQLEHKTSTLHFTQDHKLKLQNGSTHSLNCSYYELTIRHVGGSSSVSSVCLGVCCPRSSPSWSGWQEADGDGDRVTSQGHEGQHTQTLHTLTSLQSALIIAFNPVTGRVLDTRKDATESAVESLQRLASSDARKEPIISELARDMVIGVGYDADAASLFYTLPSKGVCETMFLSVPHKLYCSFVQFESTGCEVELNYGPHFQYKRLPLHLHINTNNTIALLQQSKLQIINQQKTIVTCPVPDKETALSTHPLNQLYHYRLQGDVHNNGIVYFESEVVASSGGSMAIGLAAHGRELPGTCAMSYAYCSPSTNIQNAHVLNGDQKNMVKRNVEQFQNAIGDLSNKLGGLFGKKDNAKNATSEPGAPDSSPLQTARSSRWRVGDVIGVGFDPFLSHVFFTRNGMLLGIGVTEAVAWREAKYRAIVQLADGDEVRLNFGDDRQAHPFKYARVPLRSPSGVDDPSQPLTPYLISNVKDNKMSRVTIGKASFSEDGLRVNSQAKETVVLSDLSLLSEESVQSCVSFTIVQVGSGRDSILSSGYELRFKDELKHAAQPDGTDEWTLYRAHKLDATDSHNTTAVWIKLRTKRFKAQAQQEFQIFKAAQEQPASKLIKPLEFIEKFGDDELCAIVYEAPFSLLSSYYMSNDLSAEARRHLMREMVDCVMHVHLKLQRSIGSLCPSSFGVWLDAAHQPALKIIQLDVLPDDTEAKLFAPPHQTTFNKNNIPKSHDVYSLALCLFRIHLHASQCPQFCPLAAGSVSVSYADNYPYPQLSGVGVAALISLLRAMLHDDAQLRPDIVAVSASEYWSTQGTAEQVLNAINQLHDKVEHIDDRQSNIITSLGDQTLGSFPSVILIAPRETKGESKTAYFKRMFDWKAVFTNTSKLHLLCEFCCSSPNGSDYLPYWHRSSHQGFDIRRPTETAQTLGPIVSMTLKVLVAAATVAKVIGINAADTLEGASDAMDNLKQFCQEFKENTSDADFSNMNKRVNAQTRQMIESIVQEEVGQNKNLSTFVGGLFRCQVAAGRTGPMGKEGRFFWYCKEHLDLLDQWNTTQMTPHQFVEKADALADRIGIKPRADASAFMTPSETGGIYAAPMNRHLATSETYHTAIGGGKGKADGLHQPPLGKQSTSATAPQPSAASTQAQAAPASPTTVTDSTASPPNEQCAHIPPHQAKLVEKSACCVIQ